MVFDVAVSVREYVKSRGGGGGGKQHSFSFKKGREKLPISEHFGDV